MLRLVVIHQLVLSLLVGPMLCCCAATRLGHDAGPASRTTTPGGKSQQKPCCGGEPKSPDAGRETPGGDPKPGDPAHCLCKDTSAKVTPVREAPSGSADALAFLPVAASALDVPAALGSPRPGSRFDRRSSSPSTADLLFAHHNLRC